MAQQMLEKEEHQQQLEKETGASENQQNDSNPENIDTAHIPKLNQCPGTYAM
jgi:hypothetical protein